MASWFAAIDFVWLTAIFKNHVSLLLFNHRVHCNFFKCVNKKTMSLLGSMNYAISNTVVFNLPLNLLVNLLERDRIGHGMHIYMYTLTDLSPYVNVQPAVTRFHPRWPASVRQCATCHVIRIRHCAVSVLHSFSTVLCYSYTLTFNINTPLFGLYRYVI